MIAEALSLLLVGHSLIGTTMPVMLEGAIAARHGSVSVAAQIINGAPLIWNWDNSATAQGVDARQILPEGTTDVLVITEAIPLRNHTTWNKSEEYAAHFYNLAVASNPEARVFLFETWHSLNSGTGVAVEHDEDGVVPWRTRLDVDISNWQAIVDHVNRQRPTDAAAMEIIPGGQAMARLSDAIEAGSVPGLDRIGDVFSDDIHPNEIGSYFIAMVHYGAIYRQSPQDLPASLKGEWGQVLVALPDDLAMRLQEIAWDAVTDLSQASTAQVSVEQVAAAVSQSKAPDAIAGPDQETTSAVARDGAELDNPSLGVGLAGIEDWASQQPFIDVMKSARPWIGHMPGQWGGWTHDDLAAKGLLDANGWPTSIPPELDSIATIVLAAVPEDATSSLGNYRLSYRGEGTVTVDGVAPGTRQEPGVIHFRRVAGSDHVIVTIRATDPRGTGDHVRDISIVHEDRIELHEAGLVFNPLWLKRIDDFRVLRFMDWMKTNDSTQSSWQARPKVGDYTYARVGAPVETMVALANEVGADPWFNMPHLADDAYIRAFAELVRDTLRPDLKAHVELSNEVWNWQFVQARWAEEQGEARWGETGKWVEYYALRATEMARIWTDVFGAEAEARLLTVLTTQTGWLGLEEAILTTPSWAGETSATFSAPYENFDAYAVTGYFSGQLGTEEKAPMVRQWIAQSLAMAEAEAESRGLAGAERTAHVAAHRFDHAAKLAAAELHDGAESGDAEESVSDLLTRVLPHHADVASRHGLQLIMYEGGTHVVGLGSLVDDAEISAFFQYLNYSPEMAVLYRELMEGWRDLGGTLFNVFTDVALPMKWGSWGALRHLDDDNPRWDAIDGFNRENAAWWETRAPGAFLGGEPATLSGLGMQGNLN